MKLRSGRRPSTSLLTFLEAFPNEKSCWAYVFFHRYGFRPTCPRCGSVADWTPANTRKGYWSQCCSAPKAITGGSIFHHTRLPLRSWLYLMLLMVDLPMGPSVHFVTRQLGISHKAAWRILDAIRWHMAAVEVPRRVGGRGIKVYCDEACLRAGGNHVNLFGLTDRENVAIKIVPDRSRAVLFPIINECVLPGSLIITDTFPTYGGLRAAGWEHHTVNHSTRTWVNEYGETTTPIEVIWSALKRQLLGSRGQIRDIDLWKFIKEFLFRYHGHLVPGEAFWRLASSYPGKWRYDKAQLRAEVDARAA